MRTLSVNGRNIPLDGSDVRVSFELPGGASILVNVTHEGVIMDAFDDSGEQIGTSSEMFDEIHERLCFREAAFREATQINAAIDELPEDQQSQIQSILDGLMDDVKSCERAGVNNTGMVAQLEYLIASDRTIEKGRDWVISSLRSEGVDLTVGH